VAVICNVYEMYATVCLKTLSLTHPNVIWCPVGGDRVGILAKFWYPQKLEDGATVWRWQLNDTFLRFNTLQDCTDRRTGMQTFWTQLIRRFATHRTVMAGPKTVCFLTQSVQLTLLECVMWSSKMSWNRGKKEQICTVKFQNFNFWGQCPQTPILGRGYGAPPQTQPPRQIRRFAPPCLARGLWPLHRPSLCVVDILIYFRPWVMALTMLSVQSCCRRRSVRSQVLRRRIKMLPLISSLIQSYCYSEAILWPLGDDNRLSLRRGALTQSKQVRWRCSVRGGGGCVSHLGKAPAPANLKWVHVLSINHRRRADLASDAQF